MSTATEDAMAAVTGTDRVRSSDPLTGLAAVPAVYAAIARVMADMPGVGKDDKAPEKMGGYAYRGIEAITRHLQALCGEHGIIIWPLARLVGAEPSPGMKDGWYDWRVEVTWSVAGVDGVALQPSPVTIGIGRDNTDKGVNKAMTAAYKYLLLQLFMVSDSKDDPDSADTEAGRMTADEAAAAQARHQLGEDQSALMAEIKSLTEPQRESIAQLWATEDPMTGEPLFPLGEDGKPKVGLLTAVMVPGVRAMVARVRKGEGPMPGALPPKTPGDGPVSPQDGPDGDDGTDGAPEPPAATQGPDPEPDYAPGEEPY